MSWKTRVATVVVLAAGIACAPLVLAQCAASCLTDVAASVPSCHHAPANHLRIGSAPKPCNHDHHGPALGGPSGPPAAARGSDTIVAVVPTAAPPPDAGISRFVSRSARLGSHATPLTVTLPLRI